MGFGDILGDVFDTFRDTGEQSLGVAMDYAKMSTEVATGESPWRASRQFTSSFSRRRNEFQSEHKTLAAISRGALNLAEGGLYALGYPAHLEMRGLSALALYTGLPGNPVSDRPRPSLQQAWRASGKVSLGQAVMLNTPGNNPKGINWSNAWKYGDREQKQFDSEFSWTSGTLDALMIFTDPLLVAGKGAKAVRTSREKITAGDLAGLAKAKGGVRTRTTKIPADSNVTPPRGFVEGNEPGVYYHGSAQKINEALDPEEIDGNATQNLYGPGFYTTRDARIAGEYKEKGYEFLSEEDSRLVEAQMVAEGQIKPAKLSDLEAQGIDRAQAIAMHQSWSKRVHERWEQDNIGEKKRTLHSVKWKGGKEPRLMDLDEPADTLFWETLAKHTPPEQLPGNQTTNASDWMTKAGYNLDKRGVFRPPPPVGMGPGDTQRQAAYRALLDEYNRKVEDEAQRIADEWNAQITREVTATQLRAHIAGEGMYYRVGQMPPPGGVTPVNPPKRDVYRQWADLFEYDDPAFADSIMHGVRRDLMEMGYDGFKHRGGHVVGAGYNHEVVIWFDPKQLEIAPQARGAFVAGPATAASSRRETEIVPGDPSGLSRRQRRVVRDHESILDATDGTDALQNFTLFKRHGVNNAAGLASVLSQAKHDRATRSLVLRHSMGDKDATAALSAQRKDLIDQIDRMNKTLDDQIYPAFGTPGHDGLFDSDYWDNPTAREELLRQRDESESILDVFNRTLGDSQKLEKSATATPDEVGLGEAIQKRTKAGRLDLRWMEGQSAYYIQPGVGGIVTRVTRAPLNKRPSGWVDFHDADQAVREVDSLTKRVPGLPAERRVDMMNRFINAPDDNARRQVLEGIEDDIFTHLGKHYGYDEVDVRELVNKFMTERQQALMKARQKDNIYGFHADGVAEHNPLMEAQLDNGAWTLPIDLIKQVLYRNAGTYKALKNTSGKAFSITDQMADVVNDLWRFQALFRGGYPVRNAADGQLRMMAFLGAHSYLGIQKEAAGVALRNEAKIAKGTLKRQDTTAVDKQIFGVGDRQVGPYSGLSDAMGKTPDEANLYHEQISSADSTAAFIGGKYTEFLNELRGAGRWVGKKGDADGWEDDFLRVVNHQMRNSAIPQRLLRGDSPEAVVAWLKSGEGRMLRRRMVFGQDSAEALVLRNMENLNHILPKAYWRTASERPLTADDIAEMWAKNSDRPVINAEQIAYSMGEGTAAELLQKTQRYYFDAVARLTDDQMGRHPLFVALYRGQQIELMKRMDPKMKGVLELADQKRIEHQARIWARREVKRIMFDVAQKSDLAHFVRFIMPFYAAWEDAITKYSRLLVRDPSRLAYLQQAWTAPNDASFLEVTNSDGEPVSAEDAKLSDDEGVVVPYSWAKKMGLSWSPKISKASFNIALQGDPLWLPGWGPFGTVPVNQTIRATDSTDLAKFAEEVGILPFGVQDYGKYGAKAFFAGGLRQYALPEGRRQRLYASVMQDMYFQAARAGKPEPSREAINSRYRELLNLRGLTSAMSPVSIQYQSPYQFYIDQSHAYDAKVGVPGGFKDFAAADRAFLRDFGEDYYIFRMSMSKTNVPIRPSVRADKEARRLRDLVESNPKYAALFIGPANTGEYDRNVYTLQQGRRIDGTLDNWRDTYSNPGESIRLNRVEQGWIEYQRISARINAVMESRGLTSLNQTAATDLRQLKHDWIERVAGADGPDWGQAWYADYQQFGSSAITDFLGAVKQAVADPRINTRPDIQALGTYVRARAQMRQVLQARYRAGGSAAIDSQSNGDLAAIWGELNKRLRESNVFFEDYWSRYLERDDLTKVVR